MNRIISASALLLAATAVEAQDSWDFTVAPYLWGAGLSGTVSTAPGLPDADVDLDFGEIWDTLEGAGMIALNARRGRWGISGDYQYVQTLSKESTPGEVFGGLDLQSTSVIASVFGEYQVLDNTMPGDLWLGAGLRYWSVDTKTTLKPGLASGRTVRTDNDWTDPMIGARGKLPLNDRFYATGWAYIGGFGVGSDFASDLFLGAGYEFTQTISAVLGYRYLSVDRDSGDFLYDVSQQGVIAGLVFNF